MISIATTPEIRWALVADSPVAVGVSGGKDSTAAAFETFAHLDSINHRGPRVLIHSDLGRVEWKESLPTCERLARRLGVELIVVRREAGDMMDRWLTRWANNVARYESFSCVKLILPWSTASMRFCTSEMKTAIICRALVNRFPGQTIISASGIRREESPRRAKAPVAAAQPKLTSKTKGTSGFDWHPIIDATLEDVLSTHAREEFPLHEAYTAFGSSRVSCSFCILASKSDLAASASCPDNADIYREMVELEARSTFSFQDSGWLGDVAPHLLADELRARLEAAKAKAARREELESRIPRHLLYVKGWPVCVPTWEEARVIGEVRGEIGEMLGLGVGYTSAASVIDRIQELMWLNDQKR